MHFSQLLSSKSFTFYLDGTPIQANKLHRDVGIIYLLDLNWTAHCNHILSKVIVPLFNPNPQNFSNQL